MIKRDQKGNGSRGGAKSTEMIKKGQEGNGSRGGAKNTEMIKSSDFPRRGSAAQKGGSGFRWMDVINFPDPPLRR